MSRPRTDDERGSAAIELVLLAPAFGLVIGLLILGGRLALADQAVEGAAAEAARVVSLQRGADTGDAEAAARAFLEEEGTYCTRIDVQIDAGAKGTDPGTAGEITTTLSCDVPLADLSLPGVGGAQTLTATASSPVDVYRER